MNLKFIPVKMRLPLKFGAETIESIQIAHVEFPAYGAVGRGETPLSVGWAWPSQLSFAYREEMTIVALITMSTSIFDFTKSA